MLYIITALKPEAQAFVDRYRLKKERLDGYLLFKNSDLTLIVSGLGVDNARAATQTLINHFDVTDEDTYLNVGICGAKKTYSIGEVLNISSIIYEEVEYGLPNLENRTIHCLNVEATDDKFDIVDMDSYGFYDAVIHSPAIKNFYVLKVVSDHFEPQLVTKEKTKTLIFNAINAINTIIFDKETI